MTDDTDTERTAEIDTGFYYIEVTGDDGDTLDDVCAAAKDLADRAKADATELDGRIDDDGRQYR